MALANFIDRIGAAASQLLQGFQLGEFCAHLSSRTIGLAFDDAGVSSVEGRATLELTVRLLARLYPVLAICPLDDRGHAMAIELGALAEAINPEIEITQDLAPATIVVVVGETRPPTSADTIFLGSDGWRARLSTSHPVGSGHSDVVLGAGAAACFGAANIFRAIFGNQLQQAALDTELDLSLWDYGRDAPQAGPNLKGVNLGEFHLVGAGAIGQGVLWTLSRSRTLVGCAHIIDGETIDLGNLQRYVLTEQQDIGASKVELAEAVLGKTGIIPKKFQGQWREFVQRTPSRLFDSVAVAVDSARDRIEIQASLPKWIVNAWTQEIDLAVSRHVFDGTGPCLSCLYIPQGRSLNEDELVAAALRMLEAAPEIRRLLQTNVGVDAGFLQRVAAKFDLEPDAFQEFVGRPVREFYQKAICGGLVMKLTDGKTAARAVVPMAFQSALAGIMMAGELIKHAKGQDADTRHLTRINLLRPLPAVLNDPRAKDQSGRCLCADADFLQVYRAKYRMPILA